MGKWNKRWGEKWGARVDYNCFPVMGFVRERMQAKRRYEFGHVRSTTVHSQDWVNEGGVERMVKSLSGDDYCRMQWVEARKRAVNLG